MKNWTDQTPMSSYIGMTPAPATDHGSGYSGKKSVDSIDQTGHANSSCSMIDRLDNVGASAAIVAATGSLPAAHRAPA